jgi:O-antigen/teichoic acid export membrane protein
VNPFRNILKLSVGDFIAKALNFIAFVYLARTLGVESYGVLELAIAIQVYLLLAGDAGLELWATREAARGGSDVHELISRVLSIRVLLALASFAALALCLALTPPSPQYPGLRQLVLLFGLTIFPQAVGLKWLFMGRERMSRVAAGLILAQIAFSVAVLLIVRSPSSVVWVPVVRTIGDAAMTAYFWLLFLRTHGRILPRFTLRNATRALRPALTLGAAHGLALLSFNFDSIMLGMMTDAAAVGWYAAAYKPVTVVLAMPVTYFVGLFPALSRTHHHDPEQFRRIVTGSLRLATLFAVPVGVCGTFLAEPIIQFLFGAAYAPSVGAFRVLTWAAVLVILRGTFRQALNAAERQDLDLRCATIATALNILLNLVLIPRHGILGAAAATVVSEIFWLAAAVTLFHRHVLPVNPLPLLLPPVAAAALMVGGFLLTQSLLWIVQGFVAVTVYVAVLLLLGQRVPVAHALSRRW